MWDPIGASVGRNSMKQNSCKPSIIFNQIPISHNFTPKIELCNFVVITFLMGIDKVDINMKFVYDIQIANLMYKHYVCMITNISKLFNTKLI